LNRLIITNDLEKATAEIDYSEAVIKDELKIDDVAEIKKIAYIAEKNKKTILIAAKKYNVYAQNALLKILEESPKNVEFIVLATSKHLLLDTIISRLAYEKRVYPASSLEIELDKINNEKILELLQKEMDKEEFLSILKFLTRKNLNAEQLKIICDAILMVELNIDLKSVLSLVMLSLKVENESL